jgi:hypothetical protein
MLPSDVVSTVLGLLGEVYGDGEPPGDIGFVIASMGTLAAELVPRMGQRLRDLPVVNGWDWRRTGLVAALGGLGAAAVPAVPDLVALLRQERLATAAARALGRLGATGAKAVPACVGCSTMPTPTPPSRRHRRCGGSPGTPLLACWSSGAISPRAARALAPAGHSQAATCPDRRR